MREQLLGALALASLAACGEENTLAGSAGEDFPLEFSKVNVTRSATALVISYERPAGNGVDTIAKVNLDLAVAPVADNVKKGGRVSLQPDPPEQARATVTRQVVGDQRLNFPPVTRGSVTFDEIGETSGSKAAGTFHILFGLGGDGAAGKTLNGTFEAAVTKL